MAQLTQEQKRMVDEALEKVGAFGRVEIIVDSDAVQTIEATPSIMLLKGGKAVKRPKD